MEIVTFKNYYFYFLLLIFVDCNSQIIVTYNPDQYQQQAKDSLEARYKTQKLLSAEYMSVDTEDRIIALKYQLNDLSTRSLPIYKIKSSAVKFKPGDCIEKHIGFEHNYLYQYVLVYDNDSLLTYFQVPDINFEINKVELPSLENRYDKADSQEIIYQSLLIKNGFNFSFEKVFENKGSFYFSIFGLDATYSLFEVDENGNLFVITPYQGRVPANEYILKNVGVEFIRELAKGNLNPDVEIKGNDTKTKINKCEIKVIPINYEH